MKYFSLLAVVLLATVAPLSAQTVKQDGMVPFVLPWDDHANGTAPDVSFLDAAPAGANGPIVSRDGHFYESKTGKRIRFFGVSFCFHENFPAHEDADRVAAHVAKLGFNLVRIHHEDDSNTALWDKSVPVYHTFNKTSIGRLDYLIAASKKNGVYVDLNLRVGHPYTVDDGFPQSVRQISTGYIYKRIAQYDRQMIDAQKSFAREYLTRVNPYTGLSYTQDPCVATIEVDNEDSLTWWIMYGDPAKELASQPEPYRGELAALWNAWLAKKYSSTSALQIAWASPEGMVNTVVASRQSLENKNIDIPSQFNAAVRADWIHFLADTELSYANEMRSYLRDDLSVHVPITISQVYYGGAEGMRREQGSDYTDMHAYWNNPKMDHGWSNSDWSFANDSLVSELDRPQGDVLHKMTSQRVFGVPYTLSEYNDTAPSFYQSECVPIIASFGADQDLDMICVFDYGNYGGNNKNDQFDPFFGVGNNPAKAAFIPAAAMMFREGEIDPAPMRTTLYLAPSSLLSGKGAGDLWTAQPNGQKPDLLGSQVGCQVDPNATQDRIEISRVGPAQTSETSRIAGPSGAVYVSASRKAAAVAGFVGGQSVKAGDVSLTFPAFGDNFAAMTLTAMDQRDLAQSSRILVTVVGKAENTGMAWNSDFTSVNNNWGHGPVLIEPIACSVSIPTSGKRTVRALDSSGKRARQIAAKYAVGAVTFNLDPEYQTLWYEIDC